MTAASTNAVRLDPENPWPGLAAYDEAASKFFYGRDDEAAELLRLISLAPLTVVYGKSGLGKTSLLQAGLFPMLRQRHHVPVYLRLDFSDVARDPPLRQAMAALSRELVASGAEHPPAESGETLWEYLHRKDVELWSRDNFPLTPVLVFDQFEELFSRSGGNDELIKGVFDGLADLIENRIPAEIASQGASPKRSRLDLLSQRYRIVLAFREDFLPVLRTWEQKVPSLLRNYLRLDPMSRQRAIEAVQRAGTRVLQAGVATAIVDFVGTLDQGETASASSSIVIEPVLLSLCCYQLNRRRAPGAQIDEALVSEAGQDILESFYREALEDPEVTGTPDVALFIEEHLVQGDHFRGDYPRDEALKEGKLTSRQLAALTDRHRLLRVVQHPDTSRIELIHDRLVPVVRKGRDRRRLKQHQEQQERLAAEAQAERDRERARSEEMQQQRDEANRNLRIARRALFAAVGTALVCLAVIGWGAFQKMQVERLRRVSVLGVNTERVADGRLALGAGAEPLEETLYRALAAYRLSMLGKAPLQVRDSALTALLRVLDRFAHLRKAVTFEGVVPTPALAYSPDGKTLAVGAESGQILLLDTRKYTETGHRLECSGAGGEAVWSLSFNSDGTRLAAGYSKNGDSPGGGVVCIFDVGTGGVQRVWSARESRGKPADIASVVFAGKPGAERVVLGGTDKTLRVLDVQTGTVRERTVDSAVVAVAVDRDGGTIATGSESGHVDVWDQANFDQEDVQPVRLGDHQATVESLMFAPANPSVLVSAADDGRVIVWNVKGKCRAQQTDVQKARIYAVAVSPDADTPRIAAAGGNGSVLLFNLGDTSCVVAPKKGTPAPAPRPPLQVVDDGVLQGHGGLVMAVAFDPDGSHLASAGQDGSIRVWGPSNGFSLSTLLTSSTAITAVAISPDSQSIAAGDGGGNVEVWARPDETVESSVRQSSIASWKAHAQGIRSLTYIRAGGRAVVVSGGQEGALKRWDASSKSAAGPDMIDGAAPIRSVQVSPDGMSLAAGSDDGTVRVWDPVSGKRIRTFERPASVPADYALFAVGFTGDGKYLAVGDNQPGVRILNLDGHGGERRLIGQELVKALSHGRSKWLVSGGWDGSVLEWEASALDQPAPQSLRKTDTFTLRMGFRWSQELPPLTSMDTSKDGDLVLTAGERGQVQLWDGSQHVLLGDLRAHGDAPLRAVAVAPDGRFMVSADASTILVWPGPDRWADLMCSRINRNMSHRQWREWVSPDLPYTEQCPGLPIAPDALPGKAK